MLDQQLLRPELAQLREQGLHFSSTAEIIHHFERVVADFFGAPYAVATDCCTHALELSLRVLDHRHPLVVPRHTYMSVPMMLDKLGITYRLDAINWTDNYDLVKNRVVDAATSWQARSYRPGTLTCLSFQFKKHLPIGRGGMILLDDAALRARLQRMCRDGRDAALTQWEDDVRELGFHYNITPEDAARGILLFQQLRYRAPVIWDWSCYPDLGSMSYFRSRVC